MPDASKIKGEEIETKEEPFDVDLFIGDAQKNKTDDREKDNSIDTDDSEYEYDTLLNDIFY